MTGGEMAYLALVLAGVTIFAGVLFWLSFDRPAARAPRPTAASARLPAGGAKAGA